MLTPGDAQAYCLTIAQIIPALLIALFVLDKWSPIYLRNKPIISDLATLSGEIESIGDNWQSLKKNYEEQRRQIEANLLDITRCEQSKLSTRERRELRIQKAKLNSFFRSLNQDSLRLIGEVADFEKFRDDTRATVANADKENRRTQRRYMLGVLTAIFAAAAGELIALGGALSIIPLESSIVWSTTIVIGTIGAMGSSVALSWIFQEENDRLDIWGRRIIGIVVFIMLMATFVLLLRVKVVPDSGASSLTTGSAVIINGAVRRVGVLRCH